MQDLYEQSRLVTMSSYKNDSLAHLSAAGSGEEDAGSGEEDAGRLKCEPCCAYF